MYDYQSLVKPEWAPAAPVFGIVWSILYPIIFIVYGYILVRIVRGEVPWVVAVPIGINLASNFAFSYFQFGLNNNLLAAVDITVVLVTIVWSGLAIWPHSRIAALALSPYLVWVSIATTLQFSIVWLNR